MGALARAVDTHPTTISAMIFGERKTSVEIIEGAADALRVDVSTVFEWVGVSRVEAKPFEAHPDAALLSADERHAINEMIRLLARSKRAGEEHDRSAATKKPASDPANQSDYTLATDRQEHTIESEQVDET